MKHLTLEMKRSAQEVVTDTVSYTTSGSVTAYGLVNLDNLYTIVGIIFLILTFVLNLWYKIKVLELARENHKQPESDD